MGRAAWVTIALVLTGCASDEPGTQVVGRPPTIPTTTIVRTSDGIGASIQQWREDEVKGVLQVKVDNAGGRDLRVDRLTLTWGGLSVPTSADPAYLVVAGDRVDLAVPVVPARCSEPPEVVDTPPDQPAEVEIVGSLGGRDGQFRVPVTDTGDVLGRIFRNDCRQQAVTWNADIAFGDSWTTEVRDGRMELRGDLVVTRANGVGPITIDELSGSVVVRIDAATTASPLGTLAPDARRLVVPVVLSNNRCDAHALADTKKPFVFDVAVTLPTGESTGLTLMATPDQRQVFFPLLTEGCALINGAQPTP